MTSCILLQGLKKSSEAISNLKKLISQKGIKSKFLSLKLVFLTYICKGAKMVAHPCLEIYYFLKDLKRPKMAKSFHIWQTISKRPNGNSG